MANRDKIQILNLNPIFVISFFTVSPVTNRSFSRPTMMSADEDDGQLETSDPWPPAPRSDQQMNVQVVAVWNPNHRQPRRLALLLQEYDENSHSGSGSSPPLLGYHDLWMVAIQSTRRRNGSL